MQIKHNGITVAIDDAEVVRYALERLGAQARIPATAAPRIGVAWQGGIYAGIVRGRDGNPDYHLIVGPEHEADIQWEPAMKWAAGLAIDGHRDFTLPYRAEQAIAYGNVPELFKPQWYWSCEQRASYSCYAWLQHFLNGGQGYWYKDNPVRARAVRRFPIQ